jgi:hypothetical protein
MTNIIFTTTFIILKIYLLLFLNLEIINTITLLKNLHHKEKIRLLYTQINNKNLVIIMTLFTKLIIISGAVILSIFFFNITIIMLICTTLAIIFALIPFQIELIDIKTELNYTRIDITYKNKVLNKIYKKIYPIIFISMIVLALINIILAIIF